MKGRHTDSHDAAAPGEAARGDRSDEVVERGPRAPVPASQPCPPVARPHSGDGVIRVLVVDDHALMRRAVVGLLAAQDDMVVVAEAADGAAAVRAARRHRPDVVIMDVRMPRMSGPEATRAIRRELPEVAVVALSMCEKSACGSVMAAAGAAAYVEKNLPPSQLLESIRAVV